MIKALIIPDSHAAVGVPNTRYETLGNLILEERPDVIVDLGDWSDMSTIGMYDRGVKSGWNKYYKDEVAVTRDANKKSFGGIEKYNNTHTKSKKPLYTPKIIRLGGNHCEGRYAKFLNKNPEYEGIIGVHDLGFTDYGCEYVKFLKPWIYRGVAFSHYFYPKTQNYGCSKARSMYLLNGMSSIQGHTHTYDSCVDYSIDGKRKTCIIAGVYLDVDERNWKGTFDYAGPQKKWTNQLVMLHDWNEHGEFDVETISAARAKVKYG